MTEPNLRPYEGNEPYIFLSYSNRDREQVLRVAVALRRAGYRVWWDEAIRGGDKISKELIDHIERCSLFLLFLSHESDKSEYCQMEFQYARSEGKQIDAVRLEDEKFRYFRFYLGNVHTDRLFPGDSVNEFVIRLSENKAFPPCRETPSVSLEVEVKPQVEQNKRRISAPLALLFVCVLLIPALLFYFFYEKDGIQPTDEPIFEDVLPDSYYYEPIMWAVENGITAGTDPNHFSPDVACTRVGIILWIWRVMVQEGAIDESLYYDVTGESPYSDVPPDSPYIIAVRWAFNKGIEQGHVIGESFVLSPYEICTRVQILIYLWRLAGSPKEDTSRLAYMDVDPSSIGADAIIWAGREGISKGVMDEYGGTYFHPDNLCSRGQAITLLYRYAQSIG